MSLTYGNLFAGYGGLERGVQSVLGGTTSWFAEFDKAPSKILAHHYPDVPNLGDVTKVDWHSVPKVDVITGGSPCQDLSHAGKRAGMKAGTRSGLWASMCDAIDIIRPRLVVWENVRGALSAEADSELEHCPGCMGGAGDGGPVLRALGRVLGDLAELGYDARWYGLRAADVGAPHGRFRIFLFATPADAGRITGEVPTQRRLAGGEGSAGDGEAGRAGMTLLPTPVSDNSRGLPSSGTDYQSLPNAVVSLLPTPTTTQRGTDANLDTREGARANLHNEVANLLPTPSAADVEGGRKHRSGERSDELLLNGIAHHQRWGDYGPAIARWEAITRPAPPPTEFGAARLNRHGNPSRNPRLSPRFVEWMMGLPEGWVDVEGVSRNEQLKALGNGVVPQQVAAATRAFLADMPMGAVA